MIDPSRVPAAARPTRRDPSRPKFRGRGHLARRPTLEPLEGRALLSVAGGPDSTYNPTQSISLGGGFVRVDYLDPGGAQSVTTGEAVQSDGKDVVVGYAQTISFGLMASTSSGEVARLNADGTVDSTFGTKGVVNLPEPGANDAGRAVAIQPDGKIVVVANIGVSTGVTTPEVALYRLNADGSADSTFGTNGVVDFELMVGGSPAKDSTASTLTIDPDGTILVGGGTGSAVALARFTSTGSADSGFGTAGQVIVATSNNDGGVAALARQSDGKIDYATSVATATPGTQIVVGRLNADGSVDTAFGANGQVALANSTAAPGYSDGDTAGALAVQADGKIVVAGAFFSEDAKVTTSVSNFEVERLNADGTVDSTFGTLGKVTAVSRTTQLYTIADNAHQDYVNSLLIEPSGAIIVGGTTTGTLNNGTTTLVGLNADGSLDADFGDDGTIGYPGGFDPNLTVPNSFDGLVVQPGGKILASTAFGVERVLASGGTNDFNEDGISDPAVLLPNHQYPFVVYRPSGAPAGTPDVSTAFGTGGAGQTLPAPGAYDGSGVDELGVYLPAIGAFGIRPYGTTGPYDDLIFIGAKGLGNSIPAPADYTGANYTGAGHTEVGVFEPGPADFVYSPANSSLAADQVTVQFGTPGAGNSIPVPADYDGAGHDELGVYLPASASFAYRPANGGPDVFTSFGTPGAGNSIPAPADYDGSGHTELGVYLPAVGGFAYRPYGTDGSKDTFVAFGMPGAGNSIPMLGDYDGSGHTELAVYMPTLDEFAYRPYGTDGSKDVIISFGQPGAGNTIPFNAQGAEYAANGSGGGGGLAHPSSAVSGWVDFVPDPAGQAKKGHGGSASGTSQGQS